jgi:hypothetical protein
MTRNNNTMGYFPTYSAQLLGKTPHGDSNERQIGSLSLTKYTIMKNILRVVIATAFVALVISCNKQKSAINETKDADQAVIESRKDKVDADAKYAIEQTEVNADIDKANIKANQEALKAQLDAEKIAVDADADAAKVKIDAENR